MSDENGDIDSDAPEEFTSQQGAQQYEEIKRVIKKSKDRVIHERKERRRKRLQNLTPKAPPKKEAAKEESETETDEAAIVNKGMLSKEIVDLLAAQEKKTVFTSESEDDKVEKKPTVKKMGLQNLGIKALYLKDKAAARCAQNAVAFLKKRKMMVPRSSAILKKLK